MTEEEKKAYAERLVKEAPDFIEFMTIYEMAGDWAGVEDLSEADAIAVHDLIHKAKVEVTW